MSSEKYGVRPSDLPSVKTAEDEPKEDRLKSASEDQKLQDRFGKSDPDEDD